MTALIFDFLPYILGLFAVVGGIWGYGAAKKKAGAAAHAQEAKDEDFEHAADIRADVRDKRVERLRELEGRGYRD
jgi:hypothetical protein